MPEQTTEIPEAQIASLVSAMMAAASRPYGSLLDEKEAFERPIRGAVQLLTAPLREELEEANKTLDLVEGERDRYDDRVTELCRELRECEEDRQKENARADSAEREAKRQKDAGMGEYQRAEEQRVRADSAERRLEEAREAGEMLADALEWLECQPRHGTVTDVGEKVLDRERERLRATLQDSQVDGEGERIDVSGEKCPSCESPNPKLHPAVQQGGEVQPCRDPWHRSTRLGREAWEKLPASLTEPPPATHPEQVEEEGFDHA